METINTDKDTSYSLVLVIACTLSYMLFIGSAKTFGVLYAELLEYYDGGAGNTAWVGSVAFFLIMALGPLANHLCVVYSFRIVMVTGGILVSSGYLLSSFVPRIEWMYLSFGVITGIGYGFLFSPTVTIVNYYVLKRRALANGIIVAGSGFGIFIFPYLYRALILEYGLRGMLMVMSGVFSHICITGALVRQPIELIKANTVKERDQELTVLKIDGTKENHKLLENNVTATDKTALYETKEKSSKICSLKNPMFDMSVFHILPFTIITLSFMVHGLGYLCTLVMLPAHIVSLGYSKQEADLVISLAGIGEIISRIFFGWIADKSCVRKSYLFIACTLVSGVSAIFITFIDWYPALIGYGVIFGVFPGAFLSLASVIVIDVVGMKMFPAALGKMYFFMAFTNVIGPPVSGWFEDITGSWLLSFRLSGSLSLLGGLLMLLEPLISRCWCCHLPQETAEDMEQQTVIMNKEKK